MQKQSKNSAPIIATVIFILFFIAAVLYTLYPDIFGETMENWYKEFK